MTRGSRPEQPTLSPINYTAMRPASPPPTSDIRASDISNMEEGCPTLTPATEEPAARHGTQTTIAPIIAQETAQIATAIEGFFAAQLVNSDPKLEPLYAAMRHATIGGGKYLRPLLVVASMRLCDDATVDNMATPPPKALPTSVLRTGAAIEVIHCYSLIHDDLPCMDNADLRRGRPTLHRAFDEATAVLAGDALQALAFGWLADPATHSVADIRLALVQALATAAGPQGMVGGQVMDIRADQQCYDMPTITRMQQRKTGALLACAVEAGAILGAAPLAMHRKLRAYAEHIGLAFQITDDLMDVVGDAAVAGKGLGRDAVAGKATYIAQLGIDGARQQARHSIAQAKKQLAGFGAQADLLHTIADYVIERKC